MAEQTIEGFKTELSELVDRYLQTLHEFDEGYGDELDDLTRAEMGQVYPTGWVFCLVLDSVLQAGSPSVVATYAPSGQSPFFTLGVLRDQTTIRGG